MFLQVLFATGNVTGYNELLNQMLAALEPMAEYGYRWNVDDESKFNLEHLVSILEGKSDKCSEGK